MSSPLVATPPCLVIGVLFLLLAFFLASWTGGAVSIPGAEREMASGAGGKAAGNPVITRSADASPRVNQQRTIREELVAKLHRLEALFPGQLSILGGDGDARFGHVVAALDTCLAAAGNVEFGCFQGTR